jgi:protein-S-isoprenylcysteine O-methyltransferase Ste14
MGLLAWMGISYYLCYRCIIHNGFYIFITLWILLSDISICIAALDSGRFHWTKAFPIWINIIAFALLFLSFSLQSYSMWTNRFYSFTVRIQEEKGQRVVDEGPYKYIRHPGYFAAIIGYFCTAIGLNSLWALIPSGLSAIAFLIRTYLEDITLQKELPGYKDYASRVKYRLFPGIW